MPFIPHTDSDIRRMLDVIGVPTTEHLFDEIPSNLRAGLLTDVPGGISEMALLRLMSKRAQMDSTELSFLGAGAYEHHIPSAVWDITTRGEFMTAYTPYQAEASQGTLQLIYEFQTMISRLTAMDVANASVYDGGSALAEAMLMAVRANKKARSRRIITASGVHPKYLSACRTIVCNQNIEIESAQQDSGSGATDEAMISALSQEAAAAMVIPMPGFYGCLDDVDRLTNLAHERGMLVIAVVNPTALALLKPPGEWGVDGADIVVGEGQPLGIPLASGGPYLGFMCCSKAIVRQMPGRIVGRTVDLEGRDGFALTLQAREQHIRRAKATSNICTNQGLLVTAATIYMSLLGDNGLRAVAERCARGIRRLQRQLVKLDGVSQRFTSPVFHEATIELPCSACDVVAAMAKRRIIPGFDLGEVESSLSKCLLICVTETKTDEDIDRFVAELSEVIQGCRDAAK